MHRIQSIICFNGGSAGDLVKALCLLAWDLDISQQDSNGRIEFDSHYFKHFCKNVYLGTHRIEHIEWDQVWPVENSHFYLPCYAQLAKKLYYINYDDAVNPVILNEYLRKRHKNNWAHFLDYHKNFIPVSLQKHVNDQNCQQVFEINWIKNLKAWRGNSNLMRIEFADLLDRNKILQVVQSITDTQFQDTTAFDKVYQSWQEKNSRLFELIA